MILGITVSAIIAAILLAYISGFNIPCSLISYGLMAGLPFLLARTLPDAADFDRQWLPNAWTQWAWFLGMIFLIFFCGLLYAAVLTTLGFKPPVLVYPYIGIFTKTKIILYGFIIILIGPIAEEIFFRGYLLEQLRKLTSSSSAILIQSVIFALTHLFYRGIFNSIFAFLFGLIVGSWRIKFRSLLPLIIAHIILNAVVSLHGLKILYNVAAMMSDFNTQLDFEKMWSKPNSQQIFLLSEEPVEKAVPGIIAYFSDPDEDVRITAQSIIISKYRSYAEPYIKEALVSKDKNTINGALFVIGMCRYSKFKQEVKDIVWNEEDLHIQFSAVITLFDLKDEEALQKIVHEHPNETIRKEAERMLTSLKEETQM